MTPSTPRPQSETSKEYHRRQEEAAKAEMEVANTIWKWRNPEEAHRLELEGQDRTA
jgi:hypothetical protein